MPWLLPYKTQFASIDSSVLRPGCFISLRNSNRYQISNQGLTSPAYLWDINRAVDLTPIKLRYQVDWETFEYHNVTRLERETVEDFRNRANQIRQEILRRNEQLRQGIIEGWSPDDDPTVEGKLFAEMVENNKSTQKLFRNILVEILRYLHKEKSPSQTAYSNPSAWTACCHQGDPTLTIVSMIVLSFLMMWVIWCSGKISFATLGSYSNSKMTVTHRSTKFGSLIASCSTDQYGWGTISSVLIREKISKAKLRHHHRLYGQKARR